MALLLLLREKLSGRMRMVVCGWGKESPRERLDLVCYRAPFWAGGGEILEMLILGSRKKGVSSKETTPTPFEFPISLSAYLQRRSPSTVIGC